MRGGVPIPRATWTGTCSRALIEGADEALLAADREPLIEVGLHHEQQHQELMLTDIKHVLASNPLHPAYCPLPESESDAAAALPMRWIAFPEQVALIGHDGDAFAYDNESPRHRAYVYGFEIASRLVTNGEYMVFMNEGGYQHGQWWLSDGWNVVQTQGWNAPLYWEKQGDGWMMMTLAGLRPVDPAEPVCHVSYYEAEAFARWAGARLATEEEWEVAAAAASMNGNFVESGRYHPVPLREDPQRPAQMMGDVWEWTRSAYLPYPGYRPADGALGEYNGKFMCNQFVLRGGSCATSRTHIRRSYRNFFPPEARWQFSGIRLARDL